MLINTAKVLAIGIIASFIFSSCKKTDELGTGFIDDRANVYVTDTFTVKTSTVYTGPVKTSNSSGLLVGQYVDDFLGKVKASSFFSPVPSAISPGTFENPAFDSLTMDLSYIYHYGDTTQNQNIYLHILSEGVASDKIYYNTSQIPYQNESVGSKGINLANDVRSTQISFRLDQAFGQSVFDILSVRDTTISEEEWLNFLPGMALVPGENDNAAIMGFTLFSKLKLHFHNGDQAQVFDLPIKISKEYTNGHLNSAYFNQVTCDRTGTFLETLDEPYENISTDQTEKKAFLQSSLGIGTKLSFPYLSQFESGEEIMVNDAYLIIPHHPATSSTFFSTPPYLEFLQLDENGKISNVEVKSVVQDGQELRDTLNYAIQIEGSNPYGIQNPLRVQYNSNNHAFNATLSTYLQLVLNGLDEDYTGNNKLDNNGLIIAPGNNRSTVNRLVLDEPIRLKVFYTKVRKN